MSVGGDQDQPGGSALSALCGAEVDPSRKENKQTTKQNPPSFFFFFIYLLVRLEAAGVNVLQWPLQHAQSGCLHSPSRTDAGKIETCLSFDFYNFIPRQPIY